MQGLTRSLWLPLIVISLFLSIPELSFAQNKGVLFTGRAAARAMGARVDSRRRFVSRDGRIGPVALDLQTETVADVLYSSDRDARFFAEYRGISYLMYFQDVLDVRQLDDLQETPFAEKLFAFQLAKTFSYYIKRSHLAETYRRLSDRIRWIGKKTTLDIVRGDDGDFGVEHGKDTTKRKSLVKFKLHASARNGIEPRLRFNDNLVLRLDPLHQDALLEYGFSF